jgi:hypothetical protein
MKLTDETLMAYADNELDGQARLAVELAMAADPEVARRVARHKALRNELRKSFDGALNEPVPDRLLQVARSTPTQPRKADVTNLAQARAAKNQATRTGRRWSWPEWGAMAASLVLGLVIGFSLLRPDGGEPIVARDGELLAQGALNDALSTQLASDQSPESATQIGLSFVAKSGSYCRAFVMHGKESLSGLACRDGDAWQIRMLTPVEGGAKNSEGYRMAGTALPPAVRKAVEDQIDGDPLDAEGEVRARDNGWMK